MTDSPKYTLGLIFYPGMTALDIIGPQQVLSPLPGIETYRIWKTLDPITIDDGMVVLPDTTFDISKQPSTHAYSQEDVREILNQPHKLTSE